VVRNPPVGAAQSLGGPPFRFSRHAPATVPDPSQGRWPARFRSPDIGNGRASTLHHLRRSTTCDVHQPQRSTNCDAPTTDLAEVGHLFEPRKLTERRTECDPRPSRSSRRFHRPTWIQPGSNTAGIQSVTDDQGATTEPNRRGQPLGTTVHTCRTLYPGDRVVFQCWGNDSHGRELRWWLHPHGSGRQHEVRGDRVDLTWIVEPRSVGDRVYAGVGMAADSRYHRRGGPNEEGYDGWVVFYYSVQRISSAPRAAGRGADPALPVLGEQSRTVHVSRMMAPRIDGER
jgi:hypothetical protein